MIELSIKSVHRRNLKQYMRFGILVLFLFVFVSSAYAINIYPKDELIDLKYPCFNNNTYCSSNAECNITIFYPNTTMLVNNQLMTNQRSYHNYSILPIASGDYQVIMLCRDGVLSGYSSFNFRITPSGEDATTGRALLYFLAIIVTFAILIFFVWLAFKVPTKDEYNSYGQLIQVNFRKHFREILFLMAYMMLVLLFFFLNRVTEDLAYSNTFTIFQTLSHISVLLVPYILIMIALLWVVGVGYDIAKKGKIKRYNR